MRMSEQREENVWKRRFERTAISVERAQQLVLERIRQMGQEKLPLEQSYGRRSMVEYKTTEPIPHFRRSGMDGYAIIAAATAGATSEAPIQLQVIGELPCGAVPEQDIAATTTMRIMTGAMLPESADCVVMQEMAPEQMMNGKRFITLKRELSAGTNVSEVGSDVPLGEVIVQQGTLLGSAEFALLASAGLAEVTVFRRPRVAILSTGSELLSIAQPLEPGKIRNSNLYMLAAQVLNADAEPVLFEHLTDHREKISDMVLRAFETCDVVITSGGVSVGDYDFVADLLTQSEVDLLFHKIQMRPGSVTSAAVNPNGKLWFALSGNPGACHAGYELFVKPALLAMQGYSEPLPKQWAARLAEPFTKVNAYPRYIRGRLWSEGGQLFTTPTAREQSSRMFPGLGADVLLIIPAGGSGLPAGATIQTIPFRLS
jgi:molybdopterin molybdotransferase